MGKLTPSLEAEMEALRQAYAALNRNDVLGFVKVLDPEIERVEFEGSPMEGTYRGLAAVTAHVSKGRGTWAEGTCEPEQFIAAGDKVIVIAHVHVRLKTETEWHEGRIGDVFTFRNGKAIQFRTFGNVREAFEWAGIKAPDES